MVSILLKRCAKSVEQYEWVLCEGNKWGDLCFCRDLAAFRMC